MSLVPNLHGITTVHRLNFLSALRAFDNPTFNTQTGKALKHVEPAVAGSCAPGRPRPTAALLPCCTSPLLDLPQLLLFLLSIMMVMRAALATRLCLRPPTKPDSTVTPTTTTTKSGGGSKPRKSSYSLGSCRNLPLLFAFGLQSAIAIRSGGEHPDAAKRPTSAALSVHAVAEIATERHLDDLPDVAFDKEDSSSEETIVKAIAEWSSGARNGSVRGDEELLSPGESADALLADGRTRCFSVGDVGAEAGESDRQRRCLPTVFFLGVSKCGGSDDMHRRASVATFSRFSKL